MTNKHANANFDSVNCKRINEKNEQWMMGWNQIIFFRIAAVGCTLIYFLSQQQVTTVLSIGKIVSVVLIKLFKT